MDHVQDGKFERAWFGAILVQTLVIGSGEAPFLVSCLKGVCWEEGEEGRLFTLCLRVDVEQCLVAIGSTSLFLV